MIKQDILNLIACFIIFFQGTYCDSRIKFKREVILLLTYDITAYIRNFWWKLKKSVNNSKYNFQFRMTTANHAIAMYCRRDKNDCILCACVCTSIQIHSELKTLFYAYYSHIIFNF